MLSQDHAADATPFYQSALLGAVRLDLPVP
jgi:hypothetical protein